MAHAHVDIWGCILAVEGKRMSDGAQRVIVTGDGLQLMLRPEEAATLAADLLDAIGAKSCEIVGVDNALPPAVERAIRWGKGA